MAALKASLADSGDERKPATRAEEKDSARKSGARKSTRKKAASG